MNRVVASLAAATLGLLAVLGAAGCGDDGAEPGAPRGATLVLDFIPNAVHAGIYSALAEGYYEDAGVELTVREPSDSTDAPKLLEAGRAEFAILDIHDLGIARERGLDLVGVMPIVTRPLASVIARSDAGVNSPRDLEGRTVGVTGLPSDDAVLDSIVLGDGGDPSQVDRITIGFNAVAALAAGRVDAATGFWNAEAVALERHGIPFHVFKVDDFGAPSYPELVLCTSRKTLRDDPQLVGRVVSGTVRGYRAVRRDPDAGLEALLNGTSGLDREDQRAQLRSVLPALTRFQGFIPRVLRRWARWDVDHGVLDVMPRIGEAFLLDVEY